MHLTKHKLHHSLSVLKLSVLLLFVSSCGKTPPRPPLPVNGILDLRQWDFKNQGPVSLNGYWEFYFEDFLTSSQFDTLETKNFAWVPGVWKKKYFSSKDFDTLRENRSHTYPQLPWESYYWKGKKLGGKGYASYRLTLLLPHGINQLAFKLNTSGTAYTLFVNDSLLTSVGHIGTSESTSKPQYLIQVKVADNISDTTRLLYWISNYHYRKGGLWISPEIGDSELLVTNERNRMYLQFFNYGIFLMATFVWLCFYLYRPKEKAILYMALCGIAGLIRLLTADDRLITLFIPNINFDWLVKLELFSGFSMAFFVFLSFTELFPIEFSKKFRQVVVGSIVILAAICFFTPPLICSNVVVPYQVLMNSLIIYVLYKLVIAVRHRREGALILGVGILVVMIFWVLKMMYYNQMVSTHSGTNYISFGYILAFGLIILLARMFSRALTRVENFAAEMETKVKERTAELVRTQEELLKAARQTETEKVRRRISQDIHDDISSGLNKISWMSELVKVKSLRNKAEEVNQTLDKIIKASRETVDNLIEIIWSLNPNNDDLDSLLSYMRNYITRFFDDTAFKFRIDFPGHPEKIELNPELKRNLFLVMKEALHNAAKYSQAETIVVEFTYSGSRYTMSISDNGIGIQDNLIQGTGNGMINMKKRMQDVRGSFNMITGPGKGTHILLEGILY